MGFFDDVVVNAKAAAENMSKTAGKLVDVSKMKINISELKSEISKRKLMLGEYVYNQSKLGDLDKAELAGKLAEIDSLYAQLEGIEKEVLGRQNKVECSNCGQQSDVGVMFCSNCGAKLETEPPIVTPGPAEEAAAEAVEKAEEVVSDAAESVKDVAEGVAQKVEDKVSEAAQAIEDKKDSNDQPYSWTGNN